jgi:hypothetical protein
VLRPDAARSGAPAEAFFAPALRSISRVSHDWIFDRGLRFTAPEKTPTANDEAGFSALQSATICNNTFKNRYFCVLQATAHTESKSSNAGFICFMSTN